MSNKLLPQDIFLLTTKWADPEHFSFGETGGALAWRKKYQQRLEHTIAEWLAKGLIAFQYPQYLSDAFVPVSHLVGTSKDSLSYIDSLADIADQLVDIKDPRYRSYPNSAFPEEDFVLLGECFAGGIAKSVEILVARLVNDKSQQEQYVQALVDALTLIQAVQPRNAGSALYAAWSKLHGKMEGCYNEIIKKHPWVIEHAFVLAIYPICNIGSGHDVKKILKDLGSAIKRSQAPAILKSDFKACKEAISVNKRTIRAEKIPIIVRRAPTDSPYSLADLLNIYGINIAPGYNYPKTGECYAS